MIKVSPSILSADFGFLKDEITKLNETTCDFIHVDVMDGNFVPNITFCNNMISTLKKYTKKSLDVHLMISNPSSKIDSIIESGADLITFHIEAEKHAHKLLQYIKKHNIKAGIALNPSTTEDSIKYCLELADLVLVMTVNPGAGGQNFIHNQLKKIENISNIKESLNLNFDISVDGGINLETGLSCINKGASILVAGNYIFQNNNYNNQINKLKEISK